MNQKISVPTSNRTASLVGRDEYGLIQQDQRDLTMDDFRIATEPMPDGSTREVIRFHYNGRWVPLKPYYLGNSPYVELSIMQPQEEALLTDKDRYRLTFESDNYAPHVDRLQRGEIVLGGNFTGIEEIKLHMMRGAATKNEKLNELALVDAQRRAMLQFTLAPVNIALGALAPGIPVPVNSAADLLYSLFTKSPVSQLGPPSLDELMDTELGPWLLSEHQSQNPSYMPGYTWDKLPQPYKSNLKAEMIMKLKNFMPEPEVEKLYHYLQEREKQGKRDYLLQVVSDMLNVAGTVEGGLYTKLVPTNTYFAEPYHVLAEYKAPRLQVLSFVLTNASWALTGQVPIPQAISIAMGHQMRFFPVNQLSQPGNAFEKFFGWVTPAIDLKSVVNSFASDPTDLTFVNSPRNVHLNIYIAGIDLKEILYAFGISERLELQLKHIFEDPNSYAM